MLEEPLAAFYAWFNDHGAGDSSPDMQPGEIILVCDVGGGTTDFTIVSVRAWRSGLNFDRLAVGEHLMLGGDNMDLAIARQIEVRFLGHPGKLDSRLGSSFVINAERPRKPSWAILKSLPWRWWWWAVAVDLSLTPCGQRSREMRWKP